MKYLLVLAITVSLGAAAGEVPRWLNVVAIQEGHEAEIAADQRWLFDNTVIDGSAFSVTLTPEGDPAIDKAAVYLPRLKKMKELMKGADGRFGILLQATIGHGWVPDTRTPWQKLVNPDGKESYVFCPLGAEFRSYIENQVSRLAEIRPDFFMVDDDTRFITCRNGCFCPLHIAEMNRRTGREWTRRSLVEALKTDAGLARTYDRLLEDSIVDLVKKIRGIFDKVDPSMPGMFCCCASDVRHASRIARAAAAPGQRPILRLNNGRYCRDESRSIPDWLHGTALQLVTIDPDITVLAEPDTCPQNRYSMSARAMNCHIAMSLLEGCRGAKIWITRNAQWEPESGLAYRRTLAKHRGFYSVLENLYPVWEGVRIPMPAEGYFSLRTYFSPRNWAGAFFGRTGIACAYTKDADVQPAALSGRDSRMLSDAEIRQLLSGRLLLDGAGAKALAERGFAADIGCRAEAWSGPVASFEVSADGKMKINAKPDGVKLVDIDPKAETLSVYHHRKSALSEDSVPLTPGAIKFRNASGGVVITVANTLPGSVSLGTPFSFYNQTRKAQIIGFLGQLGYDAPYYPGDAEVMLKWGRDKDGNRLLAVLAIGHDPLDTLPLVFPSGVRPVSAERLGDDGKWRKVSVLKENGNRVVFETCIDFIEPAVFRLR